MKRLIPALLPLSYVAAVVLVAAVAALQVHRTGEHAREQAAGAVELLAALPYARVTADPAGGPLGALLEGPLGERLRYVVVTDTAGATVLRLGPWQGAVPDLAQPAGSGSDSGARRLEPPGHPGPVTEFHAPLRHAGGALAGHLRVGIARSILDSAMAMLPVLAAACAVLLLPFLWLVAVRRRLVPVEAAAERLARILEAAGADPTAAPPDDLAGRIRHFADTARERLARLEEERTRTLTASRVLAYQKAKADAVMHALPEGVLVLDETGTASFANAKIEVLLGVKADEVLGRKPHEWCAHAEVLALLPRAEQGSARRYRTEVVKLGATTNDPRWVAVSVLPLFSPKESGVVLGTLAVFRDVTAEHLARRQGEEFISQVSHELKTPLNVLSMYSEMLQGEDGRSETFQVEAANVIHDEVERMSTLIGNMLSIARIETGSMGLERKRVRLRELLQDAFDTVRRSGRGEGLEFRAELPHDLSAVAVDKDLMRVAVNNLLTNAIKYNRPGGRVILSAEESPERILIRVSDTGLGIAAEDRTRVFDKFFRSDERAVREQGGHGLGLSLVREIIALHQGEITVESTPGRGSEFTIALNKTPALVQEGI